MAAVRLYLQGVAWNFPLRYLIVINKFITHIKQSWALSLNLRVLNLRRFAYNFELLANERKNILSESFLRHGIMCAWNDTGGCYMNPKQSQMTFRNLENMLLTLSDFTVSNHFTHF